MHTVLLLASFLIIYWALKREYRKIQKEQNWHLRSGFACYILCSAALFLFAVTLNSWVMYTTACITFHTHDWDTMASLTVGGLFWGFLIVSVVRTGLSQRKVQKVMEVVQDCQSLPLISTVKRLSAKIGIQPPRLATYRSNKPYAATLFWKEPVVLLSSWMLTSLDDEQLEAVIAHELAHIQRKDNLMVTIGGILKDVLFFLPTVQQTWQKFLIDLETAADDVAVIVTEKPATLASAIVRVHQEQPKAEFAYGISYFTPDYHQIEERVERLLSNDIHRIAETAQVRFSTLMLSKEVLFSAGVLVLILSSIFVVPYCHWAFNHHAVH